MYPGAKEEFGMQMQFFRANYGQDKFPDQKCAIIWEQLRDFSPKQIRRICELIVAENVFAPVLSHFIEKKEALIQKIRQWEKEQERNQADLFWKENRELPKMKKIENE